MMPRVLQKSKDGPYPRVASNCQKQNLLMDGALIVALVHQKSSTDVYSSYLQTQSFWFHGVFKPNIYYPTYLISD